MTSTMSLTLNGGNVRLTKVTGGYSYTMFGKTYSIYKLESGEWMIQNVADPHNYSDPMPTLKACREALTQLQLREHALLHAEAAAGQRRGAA